MGSGSNVAPLATGPVIDTCAGDGGEDPLGSETMPAGKANGSPAASFVQNCSSAKQETTESRWAPGYIQGDRGERGF
jgi:butyrate kinase